MTSGNRTDIAIVGGGVVGLSCAWFLSERGAEVTVVDRGRYVEAASTGNAGMIVPSHIVPLSAPGVIARGLRWLANPESPFHIRPSADPALVRWLWLFRKHCTPGHVRRAVPLLRDLSLSSLDLFSEICAQPGFEDVGLAHDGLLMLHAGEKSARDNAELADLARHAGLDVERLSERETLDLEPAIRSQISGSVYFPQDASLHPERFVRALEAALRGRGVRFVDATVAGLEKRDGRVVGVKTDREAQGEAASAGGVGSAVIEADMVVLAAGAWTPRLTKMLGVHLPVQPAKGYSISIPDPDSAMRIPAILTDEKVTITPMPGSLRFGGTLSLSGFDPSVDERRVMPIRRQVRAYCPETEGQDLPPVWSGYRPVSPDGLPFIGAVPGVQNVFVATGHGMMGVTLGPITGKLIAELIRGGGATLDPEPFRLGRH